MSAADVTAMALADGAPAGALSDDGGELHRPNRMFGAVGGEARGILREECAAAGKGGVSL